MERKFSLSKEHAPKAGLTISTRETESGSVGVTYFSLGKTRTSARSATPRMCSISAISAAGSSAFGKRLRTKNSCGDSRRVRPSW